MKAKSFLLSKITMVGCTETYCRNVGYLELFCTFVIWFRLFKLHFLFKWIFSI